MPAVRKNIFHIFSPSVNSKFLDNGSWTLTFFHCRKNPTRVYEIIFERKNKYYRVNESSQKLEFILDENAYFRYACL
ncbi:hypothetical protein PUN28_018903 [Cardiocondyla obscurior]|uniref:Uncharacterized protein n=1 Tax=Cardiocondyla obscurior TaxID=286306 RepID=A0AAW2EG77_9HYME